MLEGVAGKIPVIVDGGVRRGTDVFKALALGATAVGIGRPYAWGLAAFGQAGVETVLEIFDRELRTIMRQAGTASVDTISPPESNGWTARAAIRHSCNRNKLAQFRCRGSIKMMNKDDS